jgi:hypothetical protein
MQSSNPSFPPIQIELCKERAEECRQLIEKSQQTSVTTMLEHIAGTWERISQELSQMN